MKEEKQKRAGLTRREFLQWTGAGMAAMTVNGLSSTAHSAEKKPKYGGRLRVAERYGPMGLDAHKNQDMIDYQNYYLMYNGLTDMGALPQVRIYPDLAKSWEISPDGREYVFSLREGVKFHHGKELDTGDVKYSIERVMNPAIRSPRAFDRLGPRDRPVSRQDQAERVLCPLSDDPNHPQLPDHPGRLGAGTQ
jgi:ABC-type transport system substrate-binding protein